MDRKKKSSNLKKKQSNLKEKQSNLKKKQFNLKEKQRHLKKKQDNLKKKQDNTTDLKSQTEWGIGTLMTLVKDSQNKKKSLIENGQNIFIQVSLFKIPQVDEIVKRRLILKHPPYAGKPEVCFIARDCIRKDRIKRTDDEMIDHTVQCYEDFFKKQKVTDITTILPYHQLKCEYDTYELRRKLVNQFDVFLNSASLNSKDYFFQCLGKTFIKKNKFPIAVQLPLLNSEYSPKVNKHIQNAIRSTVFRIKDGSDNYSIKVGNTLNEIDKIKENVEHVLNEMSNPKFIPGGLKNIRMICIKSEKSKPVPLYISLDSGCKVPVPYVASNVPVRESVEGELSTTLRKKVTVLPNGEVFVTHLEKDTDEIADDEGDDVDEEDDDDEELQGNEEDEEEEEEKVYKKTEKKSKRDVANKGKKRPRDDVSDDEEDAEEAIEAAEQKYLSNWNEDLEISEDEQSKETGRKKKRKKQDVSGKPAKKVKKESTKLKKGDTKPKSNSIYGKLGKEKIKINKNQSKKDETLNAKKGKKKKMLEAKLKKKMKKMKTGGNEIEKKERKKNSDKKTKIVN